MAVRNYPTIEKLCSLVDLQIHNIAKKQFHYHGDGEFPYNLLIAVIEAEKGAEDYFLNCLNGEKTFLRKGHVYILPCRVPIRFERTPKLTVFTIRFNLNFFYGLDVLDGCAHIEDIFAPELVTLFKNLLCNPENNDKIKTALTLKTEISRLCLSRWPEQLNSLTPAMWKYEQVFIYVRNYGDASLSVAKLAEISGQRADVFSRAFSRDMGLSVKQYIADFLVRRISIYLLTTPLTLKEIAAKLKFSSEYYLSRFFKKQTRLSPRAYKQQFIQNH